MKQRAKNAYVAGVIAIAVCFLTTSGISQEAAGTEAMPEIAALEEFVVFEAAPEPILAPELDAMGGFEPVAAPEPLVPLADEPMADAVVPEFAPVAEGVPEATMTGTMQRDATAAAPDGDVANRITLKLVDEEIGNAVKLFTELSGASIITTTTNMTQRVSANIVDKPWQQALQTLLEQCELTLVERPPESGIYVVVPRMPGEREPWITEAFTLSFLKSSEAAEMLKSLLGLAADTKDAARRRPATRTAEGTEVEQVEVVFREDGRVVSYPAGNIVIVSTTESKMKEVRAVLEAIDQPRLQVYIEAKIIELSGDSSRRVGLDWSMLDAYTAGVGDISAQYLKTRNREQGGSRFNARESGEVYNHLGQRQSMESLAAAPFSDAGAATALGGTAIAGVAAPGSYSGVNSAIPGSVAYGGINNMNASLTTVSDIRTAVFSADALYLVLSALQRSDDNVIVSNPKIIVANEEKAIIDMSTKEPYVVTSLKTDGTGTQTTYTYSTEMAVIPGANEGTTYIEEAFFSYGIKVDVTPRINNPSNITVRIEPTISQLVEYLTPGDGLTRYPVIDSKSVQTVFSLGDGQTAVIGGLTRTGDREIVKKVPLLGSIPVIGKYLFSHTATEKVQRETIIFVTVGIVGTDDRRTAMSVPEASTLVQRHVTPEGRLVSAEATRMEQQQRLIALEQASMMEPMGED